MDNKLCLLVIIGVTEHVVNIIDHAITIYKLSEDELVSQGQPARENHLELTLTC